MAVEIRAGRVELLARAVRENPSAPALDEYLHSLELDDEERTAVAESVKILIPGDSRVPRIVNEGWR